ncbi:hypothetical protein CAEBREN_00208 [Caenorhabditis brenneri]|uniref:Uncharacterized protein n=1 Tax=Caenorhabditis brenneri TaxID=135651 RepID=G0NI24_CAEBE|nr:hypothetical protein CAEBREN_00208 [Caenorhabditis brenneri]
MEPYILAKYFASANQNLTSCNDKLTSALLDMVSPLGVEFRFISPSLLSYLFVHSDEQFYNRRTKLSFR